jgi:hypothetical protein
MCAGMLLLLAANMRQAIGISNSHSGAVLDFVCHFVHHFVCDLPEKALEWETK